MKECPTCRSCYEDNVLKCPKDQSDLAFSMPGTTLIDGKYRILSCLGRGGMGTVYRAEHVHLGRQFAIKTVLPDFASRDPTAIERFRQEARASAAIHHLNVIGVTDFGVTDQRVFYLVMEYVEGRGLHDIINNEGPLSPERALKIMKQVCSGVSAAHALNLIHRDLKPSNIMISRPKQSAVSLEDMGLVLGEDLFAPAPTSGSQSGSQSGPSDEPVVKVLDFGLAKILNSEVLGDGPATLGTGVMGTPHYMSPEQCNGKAVDPRSDVYSLGVVLFQMLTKEVPFKGDSFGAIVSGHLLKNPPSLRALNPVISEALEMVVLRAMSKDPANRQQSVAALASELEAAVLNTGQPAANQGAVLMISTQPGNCEVYVNNDFRGKTGPTGKLAIRLEPGEYRLRFSCPGWFDNSRTLNMGASDQQIEIALMHKTATDAPRQMSPITTPVPSSTARVQRAPATGGYATPTRGVPAPSNEPQPKLLQNRYDTLPLDLFMATLCAILVIGIYFALEPSPDPFSLQVGGDYPMVPLLTTYGGIGATLAALIAMLMADYQYTYQPTPVLAWVFGVSRIVFAIAVVLMMVMAFAGASLNKWPWPSLAWFASRIVLITLFGALYARVLKRHRAAIL
ncbi:MAG: protein kinase [Acidobacteria bacterium]|nr:protein kinase [Acidobacteriota bacterium]